VEDNHGLVVSHRLPPLDIRLVTGRPPVGAGWPCSINIVSPPDPRRPSKATIEGGSDIEGIVSMKSGTVAKKDLVRRHDQHYRHDRH
ncbi:MAG: hypothetical protein ACREJP_02855, partial [Candidatus Methylomirabilales bacterium]